MDAQIVVVVVGLIVTAIAAYKVGKDADGTTWYSTGKALSVIRDAQRLVGIYAPAADQLMKIGELDAAERKDYVIAMVLQTLKNIDIDQVEAILEAWVVESKQPKAVE